MTPSHVIPSGASRAFCGLRSRGICCCSSACHEERLAFGREESLYFDCPFHSNPGDARPEVFQGGQGDFTAEMFARRPASVVRHKCRSSLIRCEATASHEPGTAFGNPCHLGCRVPVAYNPAFGCHPEAKPKDLRLFLITFHPASSASVTCAAKAAKIDSVMRSASHLGAESLYVIP
jgi:hypothetical protein